MWTRKTQEKSNMVDSKEADKMIEFLFKLVFYPFLFFALVLRELIKKA